MIDWVAEKLRPYAFRGKLHLLDPIAPRQGRRSATVFSFRMNLDLADSIQRNIYLGTFEPTETACVRDWLRPGMTFVDVGANCGYYTALAASCVGASGRVFSIEPQPVAYTQLVEMVRANGLNQVRTFPYGLSTLDGEATLYLPPESSGENNATMVRHPAAREIRVHTRTLDHCISEWGIERIDVLKIDVEGYEPKVLQGATQALSKGNIRAILCEFNDVWLEAADSSSGALLSLLRSHGFSIHGGKKLPAGPMKTLFFTLERPL
jgi:FkbM family methyltransferase